MHHATKKALVNKYNEILEAGASDEQIRNGLKQDDKVADKDVEALFNTVTDPDGNNEDSASYKVAKGKNFRDLNDYGKEWKEGDDVSEFDSFRLEGLIELGLIKKGK